MMTAGELREGSRTWAPRDRVVVALSGGAEGDLLIHRGARLAAGADGGELLAVHVTRSAGRPGESTAALAAQRRLVESCGGSYHQVVGNDVGAALVAFAHAENATHVVLGGGRRTRRRRLTGVGGTTATVLDSGGIDVHVVSTPEAGGRRGLPRGRGSLSRRRRLQGLALAALLPALLTVVLVPLRQSLNLLSDSLLFLLAVVVVALVGGLLPALVVAVGGSLLLNYFFTAPVHTFAIDEPNNALALVVFVAVAALVSSAVGLAARRTRQAVRAAAEAETLATMAGSLLRGERVVPALLERVREAFGMAGVTLLERTAEGGWAVVAYAGQQPSRRPEDGEAVTSADDGLRLVLRGRSLPVEDRRLLGAFATHAAVAVEQSRLAQAAAAAKPLAAADRMRTALLAAVGHDLRSPLASAKAAVTSLRSEDVSWTAADEQELLSTADESLDRLAALVDNLLDLSRLQAGALSVFPRAVALDDVVASALHGLGAAGARVRVDVADDLPPVRADPGLLERVIVNLVANGLRYSPAGSGPLLTARATGDRVELRVVDRGPGIPAEQREQVFLPFQRIGDNDNTTGIGLGLALSRGLVEAMEGRLTPEDTPGGGLTMVVSLPSAGDASPPVPQPGSRERAHAPDGPR